MGVGEVIEKKAPPMTTPSNFGSRGTINNMSLLIYLITFPPVTATIAVRLIMFGQIIVNSQEEGGSVAVKSRGWQ